MTDDYLQLFDRTYLEKQATDILDDTTDAVDPRENLLRGRSIDSLVAASVFPACRCAEVVRSIEAVARVARVR